MHHDDDGTGQIVAVNPPTLAAPAGHFDRAVRIGPWLLISGTSALTNLDGPIEERRLSGSFREQADAAFDNVERVLASEGAGFEQVFEVRVTLASAGDFACLNDIFRERIPGRGFIGSGYVGEFLAPGMLIEVEAKAYLPAATRSVDEKAGDVA